MSTNRFIHSGTFSSLAPTGLILFHETVQTTESGMIGSMVQMMDTSSYHMKPADNRHAPDTERHRHSMTEVDTILDITSHQP